MGLKETKCSQDLCDYYWPNTKPCKPFPTTPEPSEPTTHPTTDTTTHSTTHPSTHPTTHPTTDATTHPSAHPTTDPTTHPTTHPSTDATTRPTTPTVLTTTVEPDDDSVPPTAATTSSDDRDTATSSTCARTDIRPTFTFSTVLVGQNSIHPGNSASPAPSSNAEQSSIRAAFCGMKRPSISPSGQGQLLTGGQIQFFVAQLVEVSGVGVIIFEL